MFLSAAFVLLQLAAPPPTDPKFLRDARGAQIRFEGVRRMNLPRDRAPGSAGACETRIGRYCYWYDSTETIAVPEPKSISAARMQLIAHLDSAASVSSADPWIAGQRVRYLLEASRWGDAAAAAEQCRADRWWCSALHGLALHVDENYRGADSAYTVALHHMRPEQRCEWHDLGTLMHDPLARVFRRASCEERARLADSVWAVAEPLWSTEGNDLRTEHFARLTMAAILERSANAHGMPFGSDSRELLLRYGWAEWYTRRATMDGLYAAPAVIGHDREPSIAPFPTSHAPPRARYAPRHLKALLPLPHQIVRFPRGDSTLLAVAFSVRDSVLAADSILGAFGSLTDSPARLVERRRDPADTMWTKAARGPFVVSVELRGLDTRRAARARYELEALPKRGAWMLSDLLLFDSATTYSGVDAQMALPHALIEMRHSTERPLGVLWEIEGRSSEEPVWVSLTVTPIRVSLARKLAIQLRLAPDLTPVRLRWRSVMRASPQAESVMLRLPLAARGRYRILLSIEPPGGGAIATFRDIDLTP